MRCVLSWYFLSDNRPLVADIVMKLDQQDLLLNSPLYFRSLHIYVVLVST